MGLFGTCGTDKLSCPFMVEVGVVRVGHHQQTVRNHRLLPSFPWNAKCSAALFYFTEQNRKKKEKKTDPEDVYLSILKQKALHIWVGEVCFWGRRKDYCQWEAHIHTAWVPVCQGRAKGLWHSRTSDYPQGNSRQLSHSCCRGKLWWRRWWWWWVQTTANGGP